MSTPGGQKRRVSFPADIENTESPVTSSAAHHSLPQTETYNISAPDTAGTPSKKPKLSIMDRAEIYDPAGTGAGGLSTPVPLCPTTIFDMVDGPPIGALPRTVINHYHRRLSLTQQPRHQ
jgi:hypothetical protein